MKNQKIDVSDIYVDLGGDRYWSFGLGDVVEDPPYDGYVIETFLHDSNMEPEILIQELGYILEDMESFKDSLQKGKESEIVYTVLDTIRYFHSDKFIGTPKINFDELRKSIVKYYCSLEHNVNISVIESHIEAILRLYLTGTN